MRDALLSMKEKLKKALNKDELQQQEQDYVELSQEDGDRSKIQVRTFVLEDFEDVKGVLDKIREGYTIALVNIKPLKDRDLVELKRAINKLKKTVDAIEGDIAGFGDDYVVVCPSFAEIYRSQSTAEIQADDSTPSI